MSKKLLALLVAAFMVMGIFVGCKKDDKPATDENTTETTDTSEKEDENKDDEKTDEEKPAEDGELVIRFAGGKIKTLNQHIYQTSAESDVFAFMLNGLIDLKYSEEKKTFEFYPSMAEEMPTKNEDGTVWTFKLRKDLEWPDGTPITTKDYEYSWKMSLDPKLKNHRGADSWFSGDLEVVNAKKYWLGYAEDNVKLQKQKEEEAALEELQKEIEGMEDGEEKDKKQAEYDERNNKLMENYVEVDEEDLAEGGAKWEEVGLKFPDDYTIEITLAYAVPDVDFWLSFSGGGPKSPVREDLYEKGMNEDRTETQYGTSIDYIDCNGPYILTKWERDQYREYVKNEKAPNAEYFVPEKIEERVVEDQNTTLQLFENGEVDTVGLSGGNYTKYEEDPRIVFSKSESVWQMFINMTTEDPEKAFLTDINFRKAMYYGMDRKKLAEDIYKTATPQPCVIADVRTIDPLKGTTYRATEEAQALYPENDGYDVEKAKEFFDKAYEKFGKQMVVDIMYFDNSDNMKAMAEVLEQEYEGMFGPDRIDVQLRAVPWNNAYDKMQQGDYDMGFGAWSGGIFNPWAAMEVYTSNFGIKCDQFKSPEFDELYRRTTKGDLIFKPKERLEALVTMEKMLLDELPMIPMYQTNTARMYADRVHLLTREWVPGVGFAPMQAQLDPLQ